MHIADSEVLRTLDLSWNHIRGKGAVAIAAGLKVHSKSHDAYVHLIRPDQINLLLHKIHSVPITVGEFNVITCIYTFVKMPSPFLSSDHLLHFKL